MPMDTGDYGYVGGSYTFRCLVEYPVTSEMEQSWIFPNNAAVSV